MEDFIPIVAILAIFGSLTAIFVGPAYLRTREKRDVQKTVRAAIDKGQPLPPEVIDALSKEAARNLPSRTRDIRRGSSGWPAAPASPCSPWSAISAGATGWTPACWAWPAFPRRWARPI